MSLFSNCFLRSHSHPQVGREPLCHSRKSSHARLSRCDIGNRRWHQFSRQPLPQVPMAGICWQHKSRLCLVDRSSNRPYRCRTCRRAISTQCPTRAHSIAQSLDRRWRSPSHCAAAHFATRHSCSPSPMKR